MHEILMFHKPRGVVVSRRDEHGRKTVYSVLPEWVLRDGWLPVGRLDRDSRGLLLFVKYGWLVEKLAQPGVHSKVYEVWIRGHVTEEHVRQIALGIETPVGVLSAVVELSGYVGHKTRLKAVLEEGKNRHLRRLFAALRDPVHDTILKVVDLKRLSFGGIDLDVPSGKWRMLTPAEAARLLPDVK